MNKEKDKKIIKHKKALAFLPGLLALLLLFYLIALPLYPEIRYRLTEDKDLNQKQLAENIASADLGKKELDRSGGFPDSAYKVSPNRIIIPKIGVNAPLIVSENEDYALSLGTWMMPEGSRPGEEGNTVVSGHRFKYLPPNNLTFYLFHKLKRDDLVYILWKDEKIFYKIKEIKVVEDTDLSILEQGEKEILTMFTCTPIYSTEKRLVLIAEPVDL